MTSPHPCAGPPAARLTGGNLDRLRHRNWEAVPRRVHDTKIASKSRPVPMPSVCQLLLSHITLNSQAAAVVSSWLGVGGCFLPLGSIIYFRHLSISLAGPTTIHRQSCTKWPTRPRTSTTSRRLGLSSENLPFQASLGTFLNQHTDQNYGQAGLMAPYLPNLMNSSSWSDPSESSHSRYQERIRRRPPHLVPQRRDGLQSDLSLPRDTLLCETSGQDQTNRSRLIWINLEP